MLHLTQQVIFVYLSTPLQTREISGKEFNAQACQNTLKERPLLQQVMEISHALGTEFGSVLAEKHQGSFIPPTWAILGLPTLLHLFKEEQ